MLPTNVSRSLSLSSRVFWDFILAFPDVSALRHSIDLTELRVLLRKSFLTVWLNTSYLLA